MSPAITERKYISAPDTNPRSRTLPNTSLLFNLSTSPKGKIDLKYLIRSSIGEHREIMASAQKRDACKAEYFSGRLTPVQGGELDTDILLRRISNASCPD